MPLLWAFAGLSNGLTVGLFSLLTISPSLDFLSVLNNLSSRIYNIQCLTSLGFSSLFSVFLFWLSCLSSSRSASVRSGLIKTLLNSAKLLSFVAAAITLYLSEPSDRRTKICAGLLASICLNRLKCEITPGSMPILSKISSTYLDASLASCELWLTPKISTLFFCHFHSFFSTNILLAATTVNWVLLLHFHIVHRNFILKWLYSFD